MLGVILNIINTYDNMTYEKLKNPVIIYNAN